MYLLTTYTSKKSATHGAIISVPRLSSQLPARFSKTPLYRRVKENPPECTSYPSTDGQSIHLWLLVVVCSWLEQRHHARCRSGRVLADMTMSCASNTMMQVFPLAYHRYCTCDLFQKKCKGKEKKYCFFCFIRAEVGRRNILSSDITVTP